MTLDGIFSVLENISKTLENKEGKVQKIKLEFDNELGIDKEEHDKIVSLLDEFENSEESMEHYEEMIDKTTSTIDGLNAAIQQLRNDISSSPLSPTEVAQKQAELDDKISERDRLLDRKDKFDDIYAQEKRKNAKLESKLKAGGVNDISKAIAAKNKMESGKVAALKGGEMTKVLGAIKNSAYVKVAEVLISAFEFGIDKMAEYTKLEFENIIRTIDASTTITLNQFKSGLESVKDSVNGAYTSQQLYVQSQLAIMDAVNQSTLANLKLANTWTNWIPIIGHLNKEEEMYLEMRQALEKHSLENAEKIIQQTQEYSRLTDDYLKKQDLAVHKYQTLNGLTIDQTQIFEKRMLANGEAFAKFNKTIEDALEMQNKFAEQSGRAVNFSDEDYTKSFGVGRLVGEDNLTQFQSMMNIFNSSVSSSADLMYDMYNDANKMGISQQRLTKNVLGNLKMANKYDFKNGTRGFIEMAKWAESARVSLNSIASAIEKVQSGGLEGVMKQGAGLQVLGGGFAMGSDPFAMMYESFSDPQAYMKRIQGMLKGYGSFNKETGETTFSGLENYMLRTASEQLGVPVEELKDMARGSRQKEYVKAQMGATTLSAENQEAVANKAQYDQDKKIWYVNTINGVKKNVADLTNEDMKNILSNNKEENAEKYAQGTLAATETIEQTTKDIYSRLGELGFEDFSNFVKESNEQTKTAFTNNLNEINSAIATSRTEALKAQDEMLKNLGVLNEKTNNAFEIVHEFNEKLKKEYERLKKEVLNDLEKREETTTNTISRQEQNIKDYQNASNFLSRAIYAGRINAENKALEGGYDTHSFSSIFKKGTWTSTIPYITGLFNNKGDDYIREYEEKKTFEENQNKLLKKSINSMNNNSLEDGIITNSNKPIVTQASNVTKINDGLVKSDPKDVAIFAKEGGVIGNFLDNLYSDVHSSMGGNSMHFDTIKVEMSGSLDLSSGGQSVDIINEIQNNPILLRSLSRMLAQQISASMNGGRGVPNLGIGSI